MKLPDHIHDEPTLACHEHDNHSLDGHSLGSQPLDDRRSQSRYALLLRSAKLISLRGEYLCIVRDVSESGLKLRLFHPLPADEHLALELATGERFAVDLIWEENGEAGFRFPRGIDVAHFIAESGPFPKRPVRIRVNHAVTLGFAGLTVPAVLHDLSRQGARIETEAKLAIGQSMRISGAELPEFEATVCWRREPNYGLVFRQLMRLEDLALRSFRMQEDRAPQARAAC